MVDNMNYLELAQECQLIGMRPHLDGIYQEALEKFAALVERKVRDDERNRACAYMRQMHDAYSIASYPPKEQT